MSNQLKIAIRLLWYRGVASMLRELLKDKHKNVDKLNDIVDDITSN